MASYVTIESRDGGHFSAYQSLPVHPNGGALVILHEIFGVNANIRSIVDGFADIGFVAIAPDLFWRQQAGLDLDPASEEDRARALRLLEGLDEERAVEDIEVAIEHVRNLPSSTGKVGLVGYCFGGRLAFLLSTNPAVSAAVSYYGTGIHTMLGIADQFHAKLLLHIAQDDHLCPPEAQLAIGGAMARHADQAQMMLYPGVGHAFARRGGSAYDARSAARANAATVGLLRSELAAAG